MYRTLVEGERLAFGDIVEADWLFDIYLRPDAGSLFIRDTGKFGKAFFKRGEPPSKEVPGGKDFVVAQAGFEEEFALAFGNKRRAIILTDDCELASLFGERGPGDSPKGRIHVAAIRSANADEIAAIGDSNFGRFPIPPEGAFEGGIVELDRVFAVRSKSLVDERDSYVRLAGLDRDAQIELSKRWSAHGTRHGPLVAADGVRKLAAVLTLEAKPELRGTLTAADVDPAHSHAAAAIAVALGEAWNLEGPILDDVSDVLEKGEPGGEVLGVTIDALLRMREATDAALANLGQGSWKPEEEAGEAGDPP